MQHEILERSEIARSRLFLLSAEERAIRSGEAVRLTLAINNDTVAEILGAEAVLRSAHVQEIALGFRHARELVRFSALAPFIVNKIVSLTVREWFVVSAGTQLHLEAVAALHALIGTSLRKLVRLEFPGGGVPILHGAKESLNELRVTQNNLLTVAEIQTLNQLVKLDISHNAEVSNLVVLRGLLRLEILDISHTGVRVLSGLAELSELRILNASNTAISSISPLRHLRNLEVLDICSTHVTELKNLSTSWSLIFLGIADTKIDSIRPLKSCFGLDQLVISASKMVMLVNSYDATLTFEIVPVYVKLSSAKNNWKYCCR